MLNTQIHLPSPEATEALARRLADLLGGGDVLLLEGPVGAGKSHFCRAFIRARLGQDVDVPSPTFTLVQVYGEDPEIWHSDLYRLTHPDEIDELGLEDAFQTELCLIEWPERLVDRTPSDALWLSLAPLAGADERMATLRGGPKWQPLLAAAATW